MACQSLQRYKVDNPVKAAFSKRAGLQALNRAVRNATAEKLVDGTLKRQVDGKGSMNLRGVAHMGTLLGEAFSDPALEAARSAAPDGTKVDKVDPVPVLCRGVRRPGTDTPFLSDSQEELLRDVKLWLSQTDPRNEADSHKVQYPFMRDGRKADTTVEALFVQVAHCFLMLLLVVVLAPAPGLLGQAPGPGLLIQLPSLGTSARHLMSCVTMTMTLGN